MFSEHQQSLKPLPVPDLLETAQKYLKSLKPLLTKEEYNDTLKTVSDFVKPNGMGEQLHVRLLKHAKQQQKQGKSWLEDWWLEYGYLRGRYPLPINLSCHLVTMDEFAEPNTFSQTQQAARFIVGLMEWKWQLQQNKIKPESAKGRPLCMDPFRTLFTTERQPRENMDVLVNVTPTDTVIVLCQNQFFVLDLLRDGQWLTISEIELQLARIKQNCLDTVTRGVGEFTTMNRETWAQIRNELELDPTNKQNLKEIEQCVLVFALDSHSPTDTNQVAYYTAAGVRDRWYDKITNFIVFENGKISVLLEHTPCDAPIICTWYEAVTKQVHKTKTTVPTIRPLTSSSLPPPRALVWHLTSAHLDMLVQARIDHMTIADTREYAFVNFTDWGVGEIKRLKASPDSFMQLSLQLAYYKLYQKIPPSYESAHTRFFLHGRTECVRTQSEEVLEFCKGMESSLTSPTKYFLYRVAEKSHLNYMADATEGRGCDRHLFGLKLVHQLEIGGPLPPLYTDKAFALGLHHRLSTSSVPGTTFFGGFGNVVPDGYGCCYINKNHRLDVSVVVDKTNSDVNSKKFCNALIQSFKDIRHVLMQETISKI